MFRQEELNQKILIFSILHNHRAVKTHDYYAVIIEKKIFFYRYLIHDFSIINLHEKKKWTIYKFILIVYNDFRRIYYERIYFVMN